MELIWTMGLTALWCAGTAFCYRLGLRDGSSLARRGEMGGVSPREDQEQGCLRRLMGRIERYDGREGER